MSDGNNQTFFGNFSEKEVNGRSGKYKLVKFSFKIEDAEKFKNEKGYVNLLMKEGRNGKPYMVVDTWKPSGRSGSGGAQDYEDHNDNESGLEFDEED